MATLTPDLCIIGAGAAGLSLAAGAAQMGLRVVLIEGGAMGGDCLNTGCVPSKALLSAARRAHIQRRGGMGVAGQEPEVDFAAVKDHIDGIIAAIAPHDSQQRFEALGVTVIRDWARFTSPRTVEAAGQTIRARRFAIATGARPVVPKVPGLAELPYLTHETLFALRDRPRHLLILGGGPVGVEMAQAHRRLGSHVTLIQRSRILPREDAEACAVLRAALQDEGVDLREGRNVMRLRDDAGRIEAELDDGEIVHGSHLLLATGRQPNLAALNLTAAGVEFTEQGIGVSDGLRTSNRRVYALGDAAAQGQYTHLAGAQAGVVMRQVLLGLPARTNRLIVPRVTYADPELAQAGLTEAEARARFGSALQVIRQEFAENDRARTEGAQTGFLKLMLVKGRPVGATIVGIGAGDLISLWLMPLAGKVRLSAIAGMIAPYPSRGEISKRAAGVYFLPALFGNAWLKWLVRLVQRCLP